jgi:hypothetical protein
MAKQELTVYELIEKHLYKSKDEIDNVLTPSQIEIKKRVMLCVSKKLDDPLIQDSVLVKFLMEGCGGVCNEISDSQAYRDITGINKIVGSVQLAAKSWYRYMIIEGAKKGYDIALKQNDSKGMAACLDKIGKYTRADKDDDAFDWNQMIPPSFEPSDDITLLDGIEPIDNLEDERKKFRSMFKGNMLKNSEDTKSSENE